MTDREGMTFDQGARAAPCNSSKHFHQAFDTPRFALSALIGFYAGGNRNWRPVQRIADAANGADSVKIGHTVTTDIASCPREC